MWRGAVRTSTTRFASRQDSLRLADHDRMIEVADQPQLRRCFAKACFAARRDDRALDGTDHGDACADRQRYGSRITIG